MVAYLNKPEGSEGFHQIVDFLNTSHIRTLDNGEIELTATIDGKVKIVTEASVRRHLQLAEILMTLVADEAASTGVNVRYGGATTTVTGLEAGQGISNID
ncbi:hypothetical protein Tco_1449831, partial [Tanacetum coccineum]